MEITWRVISGEWEGEKVQGIRSIKGLQNKHWEVKNSIGNVEAKELICTTHGHELKAGMLVEEGAGRKRIKGGKMAQLKKKREKLF